MKNFDRRWHIKRHMDDNGEALCRPRTSLYTKHILTQEFDAVSCMKCHRIMTGRWPDRETYFKPSNSLKHSESE